MPDSLLQALAYALCGDGVEVAGAKDLVDYDGIRRLDLGRERIWWAKSAAVR